MKAGPPRVGRSRREELGPPYRTAWGGREFQSRESTTRVSRYAVGWIDPACLRSGEERSCCMLVWIWVANKLRCA